MNVLEMQWRGGVDDRRVGQRVSKAELVRVNNER